MLLQSSLADYGLLGIAVTSLAGAVSFLARSMITRESQRGDRLEADLRTAQAEKTALVATTSAALTESSLALRETTALILRQQALIDEHRRRDR